jgi:hypothetical protein
MGIFGKARFAKVNDKQMADTELVRRFVLGHLPNDAGVTAAGRRLPPTGSWVCMRCGTQWNAVGDVPAQWWIPANNQLSSEKYREMNQSELPPWHCRQSMCGSYAYTIPNP